MPAYGLFSADFYAMRCGGGQVRYGGGAFGGFSQPQSDDTLRLRQWDRDVRMTGEISISPDGQLATGNFTIARPVIRNPSGTSDLVSRCTTGRVTFTAQRDPPPAQARP